MKKLYKAFLESFNPHPLEMIYILIVSCFITFEAYIKTKNMLSILFIFGGSCLILSFSSINVDKFIYELFKLIKNKAIKFLTRSLIWLLILILPLLFYVGLNFFLKYTPVQNSNIIWKVSDTVYSDTGITITSRDISYKLNDNTIINLGSNNEIIVKDRLYYKDKNDVKNFFVERDDGIKATFINEETYLVKADYDIPDYSLNDSKLFTYLLIVSPLFVKPLIFKVSESERKKTKINASKKRFSKSKNKKRKR